MLGATIQLPDGRALCFDDVGDPDGAPVLYVHGTPDSRRARHPDDAVNARNGVRLIAVDRPGAGGSSLHPGGTVGSFTDDVAVLAAHLGIDRWAVLGWSAGAPFALAMAARHPALVTTVGIVSGLPPVDAYDTPGILDEASDDRRTLVALAADMAPAEVADLLAPLVAPWPCDAALAREHVLEGADPVRRQEIESVPGALDAMAAGIVDAVANGVGGIGHDIALQLAPLDVDLDDVECPVRLWYGALDRTAPPAFGRWYAARLPNAVLDVLDGAGHCLVLPRWGEIVGALSAAAR